VAPNKILEKVTSEILLGATPVASTLVMSHRPRG
jgi:hypothetical protein